MTTIPNSKLVSPKQQSFLAKLPGVYKIVGSEVAVYDSLITQANFIGRIPSGGMVVVLSYNQFFGSNVKAVLVMSNTLVGWIFVFESCLTSRLKPVVAADTFSMNDMVL